MMNTLITYSLVSLLLRLLITQIFKVSHVR